ncbi:phosphotransferase [Ruegeria sp. HKCCD7255]|uniref:phosphotransferase n=1 Tax=Ruegeria sp. HKCCD7255 TaxID=2683004 RepID=UPI00353003CE
MAALTDPLAPPPGLVPQLRARGLVDEGVRFEMFYGGRTNQVWKVLGKGSDTVLKLYKTDFQNPMFRNDAQLEAACLQALSTSGFVPELRATGRFENDNWVYYDHAAGTPWEQDPEPVAELLQKLHNLSPKVAAPKGRNGSAALAAQTRAILRLCRSEQSTHIARQEPKGEIAPTPLPVLIHGDPVPGNILVAPAGLTLIDWQCPSLGDPSEDLALFLSPAMQHLYRGAALTQVEVARFLTAYADPHIIARYKALKPWYAWRMAAYCLWRIETGAPDYQQGFELELEALRNSEVG